MGLKAGRAEAAVNRPIAPLSTFHWTVNKLKAFFFLKHNNVHFFRLARDRATCLFTLTLATYNLREKSDFFVQTLMLL